MMLSHAREVAVFSRKPEYEQSAPLQPTEQFKMPSREIDPNSPFAVLQNLQPKLPYPNAALSYWHRTTRGSPYLRANETGPLPTTIPYAIIGSGLSGALTAFELIQSGIKPDEILILEAREAVSGSTGRNAGHVRPDACSGFGDYAAIHGPEHALNIVNNEKIVLDSVRQFVQKHNIDCDFQPKQSFDVCLTQDIAQDELSNVEQYTNAGGSLENIELHSGDAARTRNGVRDALTAWDWPAASVHPVKLTQWLLIDSIEKGCRLFIHCPVSEVSQGENGMWNVHTDRGVVAADKVIHCTNAYAGALLPQLTAMLLTPIKVQMHSLTPTKAFSGSNVLKTSMALRYEKHRYYALTQMAKDGMIIFGVAKPSGFTFDETSYTDELVMEGLEKFDSLFLKANHQEKRNGEGLDHAWSGLIAMTPDKVPYIGEIDGLEGQFICAGFNGHGMARIFSCMPGLVKLVMGGSWQDTKLPESFRYSHGRLDKALAGVGP
ncbi:hypothetical protein Q7P35_006222 [Cladosporium inversicolor]